MRCCRDALVWRESDILKRDPIHASCFASPVSRSKKSARLVVRVRAPSLQIRCSRVDQHCTSSRMLPKASQTTIPAPRAHAQVASLFSRMEQLATILRKVPVPQVKIVSGHDRRQWEGSQACTKLFPWPRCKTRTVCRHRADD